MAKRPPETIKFLLRIKETLRDKLQESAKERDLSLNAEINRRLGDDFEFGPPHIRDVARVVAGTIAFTEAQTGKKYTESRETFMALQVAIAGIFGIPFIPSDELSAENRQIGAAIAREALAQLGRSAETVDQWIDAMNLPKLLATEKLQEVLK